MSMHTSLGKRLAAALPGRTRCNWAGGVVVVALLAFSSAAAETGRLEVIDSTDAPWPSIGQVNVAGFRTTTMCTGTLIAPSLVLTAAHCLYSRRTKRPIPLEDLVFVAGVRRDEYAALLQPACFKIRDAFRPQQQPKLRDVRNDVGLIVLKQASSLPPVPVLSQEEAASLNKETSFQSVGYRRSRRFLPTVVPACRVLATQEDSWVTDCATESGASGGPLLVETANGLRVAGIMSARIDDTRSAIVPFFEWQELLADPGCPPDGETSAPKLRSSLPSGN